jgi:hypothetical protein
MSTDKIFELLDPPHGGIEKLRARLAEQHDGPHVARPLAAFSLLALAALAASFYFLPDPREPEVASESMLAAPEFDRLLGREWSVVPISVQVDQQPTAVEEVESTDPRVRIYRVL